MAYFVSFSLFFTIFFRHFDNKSTLKLPLTTFYKSIRFCSQLNTETCSQLNTAISWEQITMSFPPIYYRAITSHDSCIYVR